MPQRRLVAETNALRWRAPVTAVLVPAALLTLFAWQHPGHGVDWSHAMVAVLLACGAAFIVAGAVCFMVPAGALSWPAAVHLPWLGAFALLHGGKEIFEAWQAATGRPRADLAWLAATWLLLSYLPRLEFARRLAGATAPPHAWARPGLALPWWLAALALLTGALAPALWSREGRTRP